MSSQINRDLLHQEWVHASEEDTPTEAVYRPADYEPHRRPRGRERLELRPDQTVTHVGIGRTDVPEAVTGSWELEEDDVPTVRIHLNTGETQRLPILSLEKDRLVVRK